MAELRKVNNIELLQELKYRISENKIAREELLKVLESNEIITECEVADLSKLTKEDWKKAYQALERDGVYQKEVELWDNSDGE